MLDPTPDREALAAAITNIAVQGKSALLDTLEMTVRIADSVAAKSPVRVAILYVTDSSVYNYRQDFTNPVINSSDSRDLSRRFNEGLVREHISKLEDSLGKTQTPVFVVHLAYQTDKLNEAYQTGLMRLASATGGNGWFCRSNVDIAESITSALGAIANQYRVWIQLPNDPPRSAQIYLKCPNAGLSYRTRFQLKR
jgi:hypothetical protein